MCDTGTLQRGVGVRECPLDGPCRVSVDQVSDRHMEPKAGYAKILASECRSYVE